jgi:hypothetical protein
MIVSVTQIPLLLENVMRITPSDQPSNSDLSYRAGRWMAVAIGTWQSEHAALRPWESAISRQGNSNDHAKAILLDQCRRFEVAAARAASPIQPMTFRSLRMDVAAIANF